MGWSGGSEMMEQVLDVVMPFIPDKQQMRVCKKLIRIWEQQDCDTLSELEHPVLRAALKDEHPEWFEDEEEFVPIT